MVCDNQQKSQEKIEDLSYNTGKVLDINYSGLHFFCIFAKRLIHFVATIMPK